MPGQLRALHHKLHRGTDGAAIGVAEHHEQRHAKELHRIFHAGKPILIQEVAASSGATRLSEQLSTAAMGN
jgi:hypothetical protein